MSTDGTAPSLLARIEAWLGSHGASLDLAPPAEPSTIASAEAALGFALPADHRALLLAHDGQLKERVSWLPSGGRLHPLAECVETWRFQQGFYEPSNPVVPEPKAARYFQLVYHPRWLPIAGNDYWDGDNIVLDMFPAERGVEGQLLVFVTECDVALIGDGIAGFLARYVELIDAGLLACVEVEGQRFAHEVVPADHAERNVYQSRWEKLFDPRKPVRRSRAKRSQPRT